MGQALGRVITDHRASTSSARPDEKTFEPETGRRKYRSDLRVKRPASTSARATRFYGVPDAERPTAPTTRDGQLLVARASPFTSGGVACA